MDIGTKIKVLREKKNISQTSLAHQLGIAQNTLGMIENGDTKKVDFLLMDKICGIFNVDFQHFINDNKYKQVNKPHSTGYLAENQTVTPSEKIHELYELRIQDKDDVINALKAKIVLLEKEIKQLKGA